MDIYISDLPFGQVHEIVTAGALGEAGDLEPASLAIFAATAVAGDGIAEDLTAGASGVKLGGVGEVTNDGNASDRAGSGGAECAGSRSRGNGGAAEDGERHGWAGCDLGWKNVCGCWLMRKRLKLKLKRGRRRDLFDNCLSRRF